MGLRQSRQKTHENKYYVFDKNGGTLELPFCKITVPPGAVLEKIKLQLQATNEKSLTEDENISLITPAICWTLYGGGLVNFQLPIKIEAKVLHKPNDQHVRSVELQVMASPSNSEWETIRTRRILREQEYIAMEIQTFVGFRVINRNLVCDLYHTVYVKRPVGVDDPDEHNFYVMIHSVDDNVIKTRDKTLESSAVEVLVEPQILSIRPPCTFTASLTCDDENISTPEKINYHIDSRDINTLKVINVRLCKNDIKIPMEPFKTLQLCYKVWSVDIEGDSFPFQWSLPISFDRSRSSSAFTASGSSAIGAQINYHIHGPRTRSNSFSEMG